DEIAFSPDGKLVGLANSRIHLWDWTQEKARTLSPYSADAIAFGAGGRELIAASKLMQVQRWEVRTSKALGGFVGWPVRSFLRYGGPRLSSKAVGFEDGVIAIDEIPWYLDRHSQAVTCLALSPDQNLLASSSPDQWLKVWDLYRQQDRWTCRLDQGVINCLAFSPGGEMLVCGTSLGTVTLWGVEKGQQKST